MRVRRLLGAAAAMALAAACTTGNGAPPPTVAVAEVRTGQPGPQPITHGNDPLPPKPQSLVGGSQPEAAWPCEGGGTDGRRVQFVYVHGAGAFDLAARRPTFEAIVRRVEGTFLASAQDTGSQRLLRVVTDANCRLSILDATVSPAALASFDATIQELAAAGLNRPNRIYHAWVESNAYCGIGTVYNDDRPTGNTNDSVAQYSRSDTPCWDYAEAHEITHNLGGVQNSAPNATGGLHCRDESDVMCYADGGPRGQMVQVCPDPPGENRLDCNHDDYYFATGGGRLPTGYLTTHWNTADASALDRTAGPTTTSPPTTVPPPTTTSSTSTTVVGRGRTTTVLDVPTLRAGQPFTATVRVTGDCGPTGAVGIYVSGRLVSRQALSAGSASVVLTVSPAGSRPTIRADYGGDERCATSRDSVRKTVGS